MTLIFTSRHLGTLSALATTVISQTSPRSNYSLGTISRGLCNTSISNANASGVFTFPVEYPLQNENQTSHMSIPDPSWAITVTGGNGKEVNRELWYDTAGQNYADDLAINYDVCTFILSNLPTNTLRLGQNDLGNCSTMFTQRCIDKLTYMASVSAYKWISYSSPPPYENLTYGVLPSICGYIHDDLHDTLANACGLELGMSESDSTVGASTLINSK
jgi:hypothetical protein